MSDRKSSDDYPQTDEQDARLAEPVDQETTDQQANIERGKRGDEQTGPAGKGSDEDEQRFDAG